MPANSCLESDEIEMLRPFCTAAVSLVVCFLLGPSCRSSDLNLPDDCKLGLNSQESRYQSCSGKATLDKLLEGGKTLHTYEIVFSKKGSMIKYEQYGDGSRETPPLSLVFCKGAKYSFSLDGNGSREKFIPMTVSTEDVREINGPIGFNVKTFLSASYAVGGVRVVSILDDPGFLISSIEENYQGSKATRITFSRKSDSGEIVFLPEQSWAIQSFRMLDEIGLVTTGQVSYDKNQNVQHVEFCRGTGSVKSTDVKQRFDFLFEELDLTAPPDKVFTLTHYNLSESALPNTPSSSGKPNNP